MAGDAFLTKTATITSATTTNPLGAITPGGTPVDEIDLGGLNLMDPLAVVAIVSNLTGALTTFATSFEVDTDSGFATALRAGVVPALSITTNGYHLLGWLPPVPEKYGRFKIVSTGAAVNGTVECRLERGADSRRLLRP